MKWAVATAILLCSGVVCRSQNLDSVIETRHLARTDGKVPTYFSEQCAPEAGQWSKTVAGAVEYYEKKFSKTFTVKFAVIDSGQWLREIAPYGLVFHDKGWIVTTARLKYRTFAKVYGIGTGELFEKRMARVNITPAEFMDAFFKFYCVHELGHYFVSMLSGARSPDHWTSEFIATYFAYEYFANNDEASLKIFENFCESDLNSYRPRYSSVNDFNEIYSDIGVPNYLWFQSNFFFLAKSLYKCKGKEFISDYEELFPKGRNNDQLETVDIVKSLDKKCPSIVSQWFFAMEGKARY